jgi:hypothetical protein
MRVNIKDPFSGLSGFSHIPLDVDRKWLKKQMKETGLSAKECIAVELAKIPDMLKENISYAAKINRAYAEAFANDAAVKPK